MKALPTEPEAVVTQKDGLQGRVDALTGISVPESNDQNDDRTATVFLTVLTPSLRMRSRP
ncbi:hypothetical protein OHD52_26800 [Escherichia coli]|nr:hypothetical protein [Escherichia coli]MCW7438126.1 hypothetical protein [Escherichia coli]MCW7438128.1 hypothetical protein [Escherichia coli]MCW7438137.1 hypothetical protein [Escherichia coli]